MTTRLSLSQIKSYLPHRYPFLLIDVVDEVVLHETLRGRKAVTGNEAYFNGHFPGNPVMPGVLQIEAMGQAGVLLAILSGAAVDADHTLYVSTIAECKFRRPVGPGDVLELHAKVLRYRLGTWRLGCEARVDGKVASSATVTASLGPVRRPDPLPADFPKPVFVDPE